MPLNCLPNAPSWIRYFDVDNIDGYIEIESKWIHISII